MSTTDRILRKIGEGHETPKELYAQIPDASRETIRGLLQKLLVRGELERPSKGVYTLPADSSPPDSPGAEGETGGKEE